MDMTAPPGSRSGPLDGIRILDTSDEKGAYCTKLLADLGADVIKVEPPQGDRLRRKPPFRDGVPVPEGSFAFATYHANKRGIVLDLASADGRARAVALAREADVVVTSYTPQEAERLSWTVADLRRAAPDAIVCSITAFGLTGPYRDHRMTHLTSHAMGGPMFALGDPAGPPRTVPGLAMYDIAGAHAALAVQVALWDRRTVGSQTIDIAVHDMLATRDHLVIRYSAAEVIQRRLAITTVPSGTWRCADGSVEFQVWTPRMWEGFLELIGRPPQLADPIWSTPVHRAQRGNEVRALIGEALAARPVEEVVEEAQRLHVPCNPLHTPRSFLDDRHVVARHSLVETRRERLGAFRAPGAPYQTSEPLWSLRRPAPLLGQHDSEVWGGRAWGPRAAPAGRTPFSSVRILSFGQALAGNECASLLADLGAEVVKIESPAFSDRGRPPLWADVKQVREPSRYMTNAITGGVTRSVKGISLEVTKPEGRGLFLRLLEHADVVLENYPGGVLEGWGLGYDVLSKVNPRTILLQMSGYGQSGPRSRYIAFGGNLSSFIGLTYLWGVSQGTHNDYIAAIHGASAILAALEARHATGRGMRIDLAQIEVGAALLAPFYAAASANTHEPQPAGDRTPGSAWAGVFPCRENDTWIAIDLEDESDWTTFWTAVDRPEVATDPRFASADARAAHAEELDALIGEWTLTQTARAAMHRLQSRGLAAGVVQNSEDVFYDPQLRARGSIVRIDHPDLGPFEYPQSSLRLDRTPGYIRRPTTRFGEFNEEIYGGWLGLNATDLASLRENKAI